MTLTFSHGPLSAHPPDAVNYEMRGPRRRLLLDDFPRRVRARLGGETVLDTRAGKLLHETDVLPQLYVPADDVRGDLLEPTEHTTHCPFKGDAAYWSVRAGPRMAENAVWGYPEPLPEAGWLRGYRAIYWERMDAWLDEDEEVVGHLCDPYHRVDVRRREARVRVVHGDDTVAETRAAQVLSETGLGNRLYIPPDDVDRERLGASDTVTICPYKGTAAYHSVSGLEDAAWSYPEPVDAVRAISGHLCFDHAELGVEVG